MLNAMKINQSKKYKRKEKRKKRKKESKKLGYFNLKYFIYLRAH